MCKLNTKIKYIIKSLNIFITLSLKEELKRQVEVKCRTHQVFSPNLLLGTPLFPLRLHVSLCLQKNK